MTDERRPAPASIADLRELRDPRDMRALAHPTRLALLEALTMHGPLTATEAARHVGESPSSCSFHLRTLARHRFVEEAGGGTGRERPWRRVDTGTTFDRPYDDPEAALAADALSAVITDRQLGRAQDWISRRRAAETEEWERSSSAMETIRWLTAEEARELNDRVLELLFDVDRRRRNTEPSLRPPGSRPMEAIYFCFPLDDAPAD